MIFSSIQFLLLLPKEKEFSVCHKSSQLTCVLPRGLIVAQMSCRFCFILAQKVAKLESSALFFKWYQTRWNIISSPFATKKYLFISYTSFEYHPKCRIWSFEFWHFPPIFVLLILNCLVTLLGSIFNSPFLVLLMNFCLVKM